jgi:hypothetical protein
MITPTNITQLKADPPELKGCDHQLLTVPINPPFVVVVPIEKLPHSPDVNYGGDAPEENTAAAFPTVVGNASEPTTAAWSEGNL